MGAEEITAFLSHLAVERHVSASTQNQALAALLFLYGNVLGTEPGWLDGIVRAKRPERLPVVLTQAEVGTLLGQLRGVSWLMATLLYGSGLRLFECLRLRVKDLDFERREILVREGKGNKDRVTMLPGPVCTPLTHHLEVVRRQHDRDVQGGFGRGLMADALAEEYPNADREWGGNGCSRRRGSMEILVGVFGAAAAPSARLGVAEGDPGGGEASWHYEAGGAAYSATLFRQASPRGGV